MRWHTAGVVDHQFTEPAIAALYDILHPGPERGDFGFYLPLVIAADSVLDVGCGTGELLGVSREAGHRGRLCGLDPAPGMVAQARARPDIEWILGDLTTASFDGEFDLVVMTGHAFQVFLEDDEIRASLAAIRSALSGDGRFVFEIRNPAVRAWEAWTPEQAVEAVTAEGAVVRMAHQVELPVDGEFVSFTTTFTSTAWAGPQTSRSTLRFLGPDSLATFLSRAGLDIEARYGNWDGAPLVETSPEIISIVRRS